MKLHSRAVSCHCCYSDTGSGGVIEHPSATINPQLVSTAPQPTQKWCQNSIRGCSDELFWHLLPCFVLLHLAASLGFLVCLFFKEVGVWAQLIIGPTPLLLEWGVWAVVPTWRQTYSLRSLWFDHNTKKSEWCHLGQTPSSAQRVILGVLVPRALYNPDTDQLLWRTWV